MLFYAIATVLQLYHGGDMMHEMRRRILPTQGICNLPHHIGMVWEQLAFDEAVCYTRLGKWVVAQINAMAVMGFESLSQGPPTKSLNQLSYLPHPYDLLTCCIDVKLQQPTLIASIGWSSEFQSTGSLWRDSSCGMLCLDMGRNGGDWPCFWPV